MYTDTKLRSRMQHGCEGNKLANEYDRLEMIIHLKLYKDVLGDHRAKEKFCLENTFHVIPSIDVRQGLLRDCKEVERSDEDSQEPVIVESNANLLGQLA